MWLHSHSIDFQQYGKRDIDKSRSSLSFPQILPSFPKITPVNSFVCISFYTCKHIYTHTSRQFYHVYSLNEMGLYVLLCNLLFSSNNIYCSVFHINTHHFFLLFLATEQQCTVCICYLAWMCAGLFYYSPLMGI